MNASELLLGLLLDWGTSCREVQRSKLMPLQEVQFLNIDWI